MSQSRVYNVWRHEQLQIDTSTQIVRLLSEELTFHAEGIGAWGCHCPHIAADCSVGVREHAKICKNLQKCTKKINNVQNVQTRGKIVQKKCKTKINEHS